MRLLLDTHAFLWWDLTPEKLPNSLRHSLENSGNVVYLSHISIWEMQIKSQLGKLNLRLSLEQLIQEQKATNGIMLQSLYESHIYGLDKLPHHHRDPFDRLLISQALIEGLTLITNDSQIQQYDINTVW